MDQRSRLLARLFAVCGVLLVPWIGVLIEQLHGQAGKRSFSSSWVGLDVLEVVRLLIVAALLSPAGLSEPPVRHSAMGSQISSATSRTRSGPA
jgi:hypothetical protein